MAATSTQVLNAAASRELTSTPLMAERREEAQRELEQQKLLSTQRAFEVRELGLAQCFIAKTILYLVSCL